ncbi:RiPP maturation radical SAM C-methyltransferase [Actinoallomurus soli]|uniref:RiPP maturation radical SAM C-methyltransferase n=1 Tax=Actinoallomurus soli TaxID=2952535 RepID=UPI002092F7E1|nr:RiPP maturation radical SAM C-methyltransferase [Actinoallomurus soli]MCO5973215.1 RiPP maturation radical SAM C-methyltransferase [Actinoallomurus soli]
MTRMLPLAPKDPSRELVGPPSRPLRVALVNMPWCWVDSPSIQCGLLQAIVKRAGHHCDVLYLNLELSDLLGHRIYDRIARMNDDRFHQLGEWLFSYAAFGDIRPEADYFAEYPEVPETWSTILENGPDQLVTYRREVLPAWIDDCLDLADWSSYDAVGFSSTFLQNTASLALGRRLKERFPDLPLIYGGANFDGGMGIAYAEKLPWLDYVVSGEGDIALPTLLHDLAAGVSRPIPGVRRRGTDHDDVGESARTYDLNALPAPDYDDYFRALERHDRSRVLGEDEVRLLVEFSRGCWWGQKHHCTFCGLNALGMNYRSKAGERAFADLEQLLRAHPTHRVDAVDNILDMAYLSSFCAELAERRWDLNLFFEVKANLTREQLAVMRRAGVRRIQPGIESLSTHVLGLMRKGSSKLINIRLLKWARYHGISTEWHILRGFPGETDQDYAEQAELVPLLYHLQPPTGQLGIWLERFSPYFTDRSFAISGVRPQASYAYVYPPELDHSRIAYFFDFEASDVASADSHELLTSAALEWKRRWASGDRPVLFYERLPGRLKILDTRSGRPRKAVLHGWQAEAYEACGDTARAGKRVHQSLLDGGFDLSLGEVAAFLDDCCRLGVMVSEDDKYLSLALPGNPGW